MKIHIIFYFQHAKLHNAPYEEVHLGLLQSFLKIKLKADSQLFEKFMDNFYSPSFCAFNHLN